MNTAVTEYGRVLRARRRWLMWGVLLALIATTAVLIMRPPLYRSTATIFVRTPGDVSWVMDGGDSYAQARAETFAALATSTSVTSRVVADLGLKLTPETLAERIKAAHRGGTALMDVTVSAPSAAEAQRTATVLLTELSTTVYFLESVPGSLVPRSELIVVDPPSQPVHILAWGAPIWLVLLGSALIGLLLGAVGAVLRSLDQQSVGDVDRAQGCAADASAVPVPANTAPDALAGSDATTDSPPTGSDHGMQRAARQMPAAANEGNA